jgi:hypothetical protein
MKGFSISVSRYHSNIELPETNIIHCSQTLRLLFVSTSNILQSRFGITLPTVHGFEPEIGLMDTTGEHSVIPYHSSITPFGAS